MGSEIYYSLMMSLLLTILIESAVALLWGYRKKDTYLVLLLCNLLTNPAVVYLHALLPKATLLLEAAAVLIEWRCYRARAPEVKRPLLFSFAANAASFLIGLLL